MNKHTRVVLAGVGTLALVLAPLSAATAGDHGHGGHYGYRTHGLWLGGAIVGAVVDLVTLPLQIVAAATDPERQRMRADYGPPVDYYRQAPREYAPPPRYYPQPQRGYAPPAEEYDQPQAYYPRPNTYYAPRQYTYDAPRGYASRHSRYYSYPR